VPCASSTDRTPAETIPALAATVNDINTGRRRRVALDGAGPAAVPALTQQTAPDGTAAADGPSATGRGRRKAAGPA
jgi:hypothetical protein